MKKGSRILIVEDEMVISLEISQTLKRLGYDVAGQAIDGTDAIRLAHEVDPDLILMDIRLNGGMDGIEAASRIKEQLDIPVIFLSAHSDEATLERAIAVSPSGYLIKPFKDRELYSTIELSLHKHNLWKRIRPRLTGCVDTGIDMGIDIFDKPGVSVLRMSIKGIIDQVNSELCTLFGADSNDICGTRITGWIAGKGSSSILFPRKDTIIPGYAVLHRRNDNPIPVRIECGFIAGEDALIRDYLLKIYPAEESDVLAT
jgi:CheY-like chemotaxis protein